MAYCYLQKTVLCLTGMEGEREVQERRERRLVFLNRRSQKSQIHVTKYPVDKRI